MEDFRNKWNNTPDYKQAMYVCMYIRIYVRMYVSLGKKKNILTPSRPMKSLEINIWFFVCLDSDTSVYFFFFFFFFFSW